MIFIFLDLQRTQMEKKNSPEENTGKSKNRLTNWDVFFESRDCNNNGINIRRSLGVGCKICKDYHTVHQLSVKMHL